MIFWDYLTITIRCKQTPAITLIRISARKRWDGMAGGAGEVVNARSTVELFVCLHSICPGLHQFIMEVDSYHSGQLVRKAIIIDVLISELIVIRYLMRSKRIGEIIFAFEMQFELMIQHNIEAFCDKFHNKLML